MRSKRPGAATAVSRPSPTTALVAQLSMQVQAFARFYQLRNRDRVCRFGLTVSECYALEAIVESGGLSVTALAFSLGLNKSNASRVVERLGRPLGDRNHVRRLLVHETHVGIRPEQPDSHLFQHRLLARVEAHSL